MFALREGVSAIPGTRPRLRKHAGGRRAAGRTPHRRAHGTGQGRQRDRSDRLPTEGVRDGPGPGDDEGRGCGRGASAYRGGEAGLRQDSERGEIEGRQPDSEGEGDTRVVLPGHVLRLRLRRHGKSRWSPSGTPSTPFRSSWTFPRSRRSWCGPRRTGCWTIDRARADRLVRIEPILRVYLGSQATSGRLPHLPSVSVYYPVTTHQCPLRPDASHYRDRETLVCRKAAEPHLKDGGIYRKR